MTEYIDRQALEMALNHRLSYLIEEYSVFDHYTTGYSDAVFAVEDFPSADAVPVVRCKDCINYIGGTCWRCGLDYSVIVDADDFCSRGVTE